jgi:hypothetical protein
VRLHFSNEPSLFCPSTFSLLTDHLRSRLQVQPRCSERRPYDGQTAGYARRGRGSSQGQQDRKQEWRRRATKYWLSMRHSLSSTVGVTYRFFRVILGLAGYAHCSWRMPFTVQYFITMFLRGALWSGSSETESALDLAPLVQEARASTVKKNRLGPASI